MPGGTRRCLPGSQTRTAANPKRLSWHCRPHQARLEASQPTSGTPCDHSTPNHLLQHAGGRGRVGDCAFHAPDCCPLQASPLQAAYCFTEFSPHGGVAWPQRAFWVPIEANAAGIRGSSHPGIARKPEAVRAILERSAAPCQIERFVTDHHRELTFVPYCAAWFIAAVLGWQHGSAGAYHPAGGARGRYG